MEQLGHKRLAEAHDFVVGFPLWVEICPAFAAAHRQIGERVFKNLLKGEELEDAGVNGRVEAQPAFVRSESAIHLDAETAVDLNLAFIINPRDAELNHALRLDDAFEDFAVAILLVPLDSRFDRLENFGNRLKKLRLIRVTPFDDVENLLN